MRRIKIGTAMLVSLVVFVVPTVGLWLLLELTGPRWGARTRDRRRRVGALGALVVGGWLVRARRHERQK